MKISLLIPAHNEEEIIASTIKSIEQCLELDYQIIVINDHSTDNTVSIIRDLMKSYKNLQLVNNETGRGFADALREGFKKADSELVIPVMADLCDDPLTINEMHEKAKQGYDIICGSRYMDGGLKTGGPKLQSFFSSFVGRSLKYLIGIPTSDVSNSFKCYRKEVLSAVNTESKAFEISMELALKAHFLGFKITEIPTIWKGRSLGKSKFYLFKVAPNYIRLYFWAIFNNLKLRK